VLIPFLLSLALADNRYAFIYSKNIDDSFINFYDKVVVEADAIDNIYATRYPDRMVAYISVGEIEPWRNRGYKNSWIISKNLTWNSLIANLDKKEYQKFLLQRVEKLYKMGYRNFFLDTIDAYNRIKDKRLKVAVQNGVIEFIKELKKRYPKSKIIINRGFEILDRVYKYIDAIVAESLIAGYDHSKKIYKSVSIEDRKWLLKNLKRAKKLGLDVISIDYSNKSTKDRIDIAKKIRALGVIPYVTDGLLQEQGECDIKRVRRNILILFNRSLFKDNNEVYSDVHLIASMPIEHLGYIPILYDISTKPLPKRVEDRFHAVLIWSDGETKNSKNILNWTKKTIKKGIKVLFLKNFIFEPNSANLKFFGLKSEENKNTLLSTGKIVYHNPFKPYEIKAYIENRENIIVANSDKIKPIVSIEYKNGQIYTPIAITPWGGYAYGNSFLLSVANKSLWTIDPFKFFKMALGLDLEVIPDPTTEGGRRELFVHIDGDGFIEKYRLNPKKYAPEILIDKIFKKYKIPQSVSIIQGEVDTIGLRPKLTPKLIKIAKKLYEIPWIEPASHSFSHPFFWHKAIVPKNASPKAGKHYHLNIPNYHFSLKQETIDSINFALSLSPKYKRDKKILFWSGDCLPPKSVLKYIEKNGILAMNGGDTTITKENPFKSFIAPFGIQREEYWQIYTGAQNENIYTNEWRGPFWGYKRAIETFKLTETPQRLKPINIYYHLYSGSRLASLRALDEVYRWAISQKTTNIYASDYIKKVKDFYSTSIAKLDNREYEVRNSGNLRTLRVDNSVFVDIKDSVGVGGFKREKNRTYIILDTKKRYIIRLSNKIPDTPYLIDINGWIEEYNRGVFKLKSYMPIKAKFYLPKNCSFNLSKGVEKKIKNHILEIYSKEKRGAIIEFECK